MEGQKSHRDFGYSVVNEKTQTEGVIPVAKTTVALDNEIVQSLLQGDLTCLQSVVKDLIEHALETKAEEILQACLLQTKNGHQEVRTKCTKRTVSRSMPC